MMKFLYLLVFIPLTSFGQNLVPNSSFESYSSCPGGFAQMNLAIPWTDPTNSSSDYFNSCSIDPSVDVPNNFYLGGGFQLPHSGNGYAGFYSYAQFSREYIQVPLFDSLTSGIVYRAEFYVNLCNIERYAIDILGAYFSSTAITTSIGNVLNYVPQVSSPSGIYLSDTLNWMKISGIFTAFGGEKFLTIGNFKDDASTNKIIVNPTGIDSSFSYYYVDDVMVYPDSITSVQEINHNTNFSIYPNPAKDELFISSGNLLLKQTDIEITDISGKHVYQKQIEMMNGIGKLDLNLENGIYLINIIDTANTKVKTQKIVIAK